MGIPRHLIASADNCKHWPVIALCMLGIVFDLWIVSLSHAKRGVDFAQFYAAGRLAGTGHLYDWASLQALERQNSPVVAPTARLPVTVFTYKLLSFLPYHIARKLWLFASIVAGVLGIWFWPQCDRLVLLLGATWSLPLCMSLYYGQDVLFWFCFFAFGLYLLDKERTTVAGAVFTLCMCKYHLLIGLGIMLIARRQWRTLLSGLLSGLVLFFLCFWIEGWRWPAMYRNMTALPEFSPFPERMPDLYGIASRSPYPLAIEISLCILSAACLWFACRRLSVGVSGTLAAASGLLFAHHAYAYDCILLLPLLVTVAPGKHFPTWLRLLALLLLSPALILFLSSDYSLIAQISVVTFVMGAAVLAGMRHGRFWLVRPGLVTQS